MKRTLVATLLGLTACTTAFGQGVIAFNNYISTTYQQVMWANDAPTVAALGSLAGKPITDPHVEVQLFWALGNLTTSEDLPQFYSTANAGVTTFIDGGNTFNGGGYYEGPNQLLTGWTPSQTVTFGVKGWETSGPWANIATGETTLWTEKAGATASSHGIQPSSQPATGFENGPPTLTLFIDPEPSQFALSALGAAALVFSRRKKKLPVSTGHKQLTTDY